MVACERLPVLKNLIDIAVRQGTAAAIDAINRSVDRGDCQIFKAGEKVHVVERGFGTRCIVRFGKPGCWWINSTAIDER